MKNVIKGRHITLLKDNTPSTVPAAEVSRWRQLISVVALLAGVSLFVYPVVATVINNQEHQRVVKQVITKANSMSAVASEAAFTDAETYNKNMTNGPFLDPFLQKVVPNSPEYHKYLKTLDFENGVMGSVHIPTIKVTLPIYHGTSDAVLDKGAGHLFGASLPVGGNSTKTIITAHSGLGNASMFDDIRYIKNGDAVFLNIGSKTLKYEVYGQKVVLPDKTDDLLIEKNKDLAVLITCTPYGINSHRLLVFAKRVPYNPQVDAAVATEQFESSWRFWMYFSVAAVLLSLLLYLWIVILPRYRKSHKQKTKKRWKIITAVIPAIHKIPSGMPEGGGSF